VTKYSTMGFAEMIEDPSNAVRRKDPPSTAQAAVERLRDREDARQDVAQALERLAARLREPTPVPVEVPSAPQRPRSSPVRAAPGQGNGKFRAV
jgi:hypothetical protein